MNACMQMLKQMEDVAMEEYGEIVVLQSCWVGVPKSQKIPGRDRVAPFVLLGDDAFGLKKYLMKPSSQKGLIDEKRVYNYHHCRASQISKYLLGIILNR